MGKFSKGSNSLSKKLGDLADKAEKLDETNFEFNQEDLFNDSFMIENTKFKCFSDFIESSPVDVQSQEDFDSLKIMSHSTISLEKIPNTKTGLI